MCSKHDIFTHEDNMLSSGMKTSLLLWLHENHTFPCSVLKKILKWNDWCFIGVYIIIRILHGHLAIPNFPWREISYLRVAILYFLTKFEVPKVCYEPRFFCSDLWLKCKNVWAISPSRKKKVSRPYTADLELCS